MPLAKRRLWTTGWLPKVALAPGPPIPAPEASDWIGTWYPEAKIEIKNGVGRKLSIEAVRVIETPSGDTHNVTFRALVKPGPGTLALTDEGSYGEGYRVRMQRIGPWLADRGQRWLW